MHQIILYEDRNGISPVDEYLRELDSQNTKDARIRREKIRTYVKILKERGLPIPEPLCKHMVDKIYELRPIGDRVFFAGWIDGAYVLLHCYKKQGQKTPPREIKKAQEEFADFMKRWEKNGKG